MYEEVYATYISPKHILVPCDCRKGFHKFGSSRSILPKSEVDFGGCCTEVEERGKHHW